MRTETKWALFAVLGIWASVAAITAYAPDLINIADDEHVPITGQTAAHA